MAQYTKRTCVNCGLRDIQPNMRQKEIYAESGKSKKGFSGSTVVGSMLGNQKSSKSIADSLLNNNQRTYYRKRKVWLCGNCYSKVKTNAPSSIDWKFWFIVIITSPIWLAFLQGFISGL